MFVSVLHITTTFVLILNPTSTKIHFCESAKMGTTMLAIIYYLGLSSCYAICCLSPPTHAWVTTAATAAATRNGVGGDCRLGMTTTEEDPTTSTTASSGVVVVPSSENNRLLEPNYKIEPLPIRIGHGFDIHRMAPIQEAGQPIVIGGVVIPHQDQKWTDVEGKYVEKGGIYETQLGVMAHSDGDVIYHSIVDAIFGALTLPDIGQVFQDSDPQWRGCDSSKFMEHAYDIMYHKYGYQLGNVDVTLILERPKVAAFKPAMKDNIVRLLHTTPGRVNIKARTHERVDSIGELRSLSCHVVLTLERRTSA